MKSLLKFYATCWVCSVVPIAAVASSSDTFSKLQRATRWSYAQQCNLAYHQFEEVVITDPSLLKRSRAEYEAALCLLKLAPEQAERVLLCQVAKTPNTHTASFALYHLGNAAFAAEKFSESIDFYTKVQSEHLSELDTEQLHYRIAYAYFSQQNWQKAIQHFDAARTHQGTYLYAACYYAGYARLRSTHYQEALENFEEAAQHSTYLSAVPTLIAQTYYEQRKFKDLLSYIDGTKGLSIKPRDKQLLSLMAAEAHYFIAEYHAAGQCYERYLAHTAGTPDSSILCRTACAFLQTGAHEKALHYFQSICSDSGPIGQYACYCSALLCLLQERPEAARTVLEKSAEREGHSELIQEVLFLYAELSHRLGYVSEAIRTLEQIIKRFPHHRRLSDIRTLLNASYLVARRYESVVAQIEGQNTPLPKDRELYQKAAFYRGCECFNATNYTQSVRWLQKSLQYPADPVLVENALIWLGESYSAMQVYTQAQQMYRRVLKLPSVANHPGTLRRAYYGLGYASFNATDYAEAAQCFTAYLELGASDLLSRCVMDVQLRLADCRYGLKAYPQALESYQRLHTYHGSYTHHQCARIYKLLQQYDLSRVEYHKVLAERTEATLRAEALFELARLELEQSRYAKAIEYFTKLIIENDQSDRLSEALLGRALAHTNIKHYQEAIQDCIHILKTPAPNHLTARNALLELAKLLTLTKRSDELPECMRMYQQLCGQRDASVEMESALFDLAKATFYAENYDSAVVQLDNFQKSYPNSSYTEEALLMSAEACCLQQNEKEALQRYKKLLNVSEEAALRLKALRRLAALSHRQGMFAEACHYYEQLYACVQTGKEASRALVGLMETRYKLERYSAAIESAEALLKLPDLVRHDKYKAHLLLGTIAMQRLHAAKAQQHFTAASASKDPTQGAEALYKLAQLHHERGHYQLSLSTLFELNKRFPKQISWTCKAFLLIADNYIALQDYTHARAALRSLVDHASDEAIKTVAQHKLSQLHKHLEASHKQSQGDRTTAQVPIPTSSHYEDH